MYRQIAIENLIKTQCLNKNVITNDERETRDSREIKRELRSKFLLFCWPRYIGILYKSDIGEFLNKWSRKE